MLSIFISHSHKDVELVRRLIALLRSSLNLPSKEIRATSLDGFRLPGGANTADRLRHEVQEAKVLIGIISISSLNSTYVIFELGARWGSGKPMVPLLVSDVDLDLLAEPLQEMNALSCRSSAQLYQLVEDIAGYLGVPVDSAAAYQEYVEDIVNFCEDPSSSEKEELERAAARTVTAALAGIAKVRRSDDE